jgi:hypothetical protein
MMLWFGVSQKGVWGLSRTGQNNMTAIGSIRTAPAKWQREVFRVER